MEGLKLSPESLKGSPENVTLAATMTSQHVDFNFKPCLWSPSSDTSSNFFGKREVCHVNLKRNERGLVGLEFMQHPDYERPFAIIGVRPGGPAASSDEMSVGDYMLAVDFEPLSGKSTQQVVNMLTGTPRSEVVVSIQRSNGSIPCETLNNIGLLVKHSKKSDCPDAFMWLSMICVAKLARPDPQQTNEIFDSSAVDQVIKAMHRHGDNVKLQHMATWFLWALACQEEVFRAQMLSSGVISAVVNTMAKHENDAALQQQAILVIHALVVSVPSSRVAKERFLAAGGRELIEQALETHGQGPNGVRDCAVSCLSFLLQDVGSEEGNPPTLVSLDD